MPMSWQPMAWMWKWFGACNLESYRLNRARMQRLAFYSRERLHQLSVELECGPTGGCRIADRLEDRQQPVADDLEHRATRGFDGGDLRVKGVVQQLDQRLWGQLF